VVSSQRGTSAHRPADRSRWRRYFVLPLQRSADRWLPTIITPFSLPVFSTIAVGDGITFIVTLTNHGPNGATNLAVTDTLPAGLTFISATPSQGTYSTVNALNTTLGGLPGANVTANGNTTINAINGTFSASGAGYTRVRVFNVTSFNVNNGQNLTINGRSDLVLYTAHASGSPPYNSSRTT
jgi:uncharacterized repeat protein (TIGR01451 family)